MPESKKTRTKAARPRPASRRDGQMHVLKLYVAGINPRSSAAIENLTEICEEFLHDRYELEVVDLYQQPTLARGEQIIAAPTMIKKLPVPMRRLIGDMADKEKVLVGLDLKPKR